MISYIHSGRFSLEVWIARYDDLTDAIKPLKQRAKSKLTRSKSPHGRYSTAEYMVSSFEYSCVLKSKEILIFFDYTYHAAIPLFIETIVTLRCSLILVCPTCRTYIYLGVHFFDIFLEISDICLISRHQKKCQPGCCLLPYARQKSDAIYELFECFWHLFVYHKIGHLIVIYLHHTIYVSKKFFE